MNEKDAKEKDKGTKMDTELQVVDDLIKLIENSIYSI